MKGGYERKCLSQWERKKMLEWKARGMLRHDGSLRCDAKFMKPRKGRPKILGSQIERAITMFREKIKKRITGLGNGLPKSKKILGRAAHLRWYSGLKKTNPVVPSANILQ